MMAAAFHMLTLGAAPSVLAITRVGRNHILMDHSGSLRLKIPSIPTARGVVSIISSPGTTSYFGSVTEDDSILALEEDSDSNDESSSSITLICRGATLKGTSAAERSALAATSWVSDVVIVDGITEGDVEAAGWRNTRHARSLTAIFRSRLAMTEPRQKQTLFLCVKNSGGRPSSLSMSSLEPVLQKDIRALFEATAAETKGSVSFDSLYDVSVVSVITEAEAQQVCPISASGCAPFSD
jgi:hypothetical protein